MPQAFSSVTSLMGGLRVNYQLGLAAYDDPAGKIALCVSGLNQLFAQVSYIQNLLTCANLSAIGFSTLSTTAFSNTPVVIGNWAST